MRLIRDAEEIHWETFIIPFLATLLIAHASNSKRNRRSGTKTRPLVSETSSSCPHLLPLVIFTVFIFVDIVDKFLDNNKIYLITGFCVIMGIIAVNNTIFSINVISNIAPYRILITDGTDTRVTRDTRLTAIPFTLTQVITLILSMIIIIIYIITDNWIISNILCFVLAFNSIQIFTIFSLDPFRYKITLFFWLFFYYETLVTKSFGELDKVVWPKKWYDISTDGTIPAVLALEDIIIPGIYIASTLRIDKLQFWSCLFTYFCGLLFKNTAQPTPIYLTLLCILITLIMNLLKGDLFNFSTEIEDTENDNEDHED
jgi:hypothetical protein